MKLSIGAGVAGVVVVVGLLSTLGSWFTVDQTERGVLLRNGAFVEVVQPGLHFKYPWIESVTKIDMQTHTMTYGDQANGGIEAYSADQQPANMRVSVTYHVSADKLQEMYDRFQGDKAAAVTRLITPKVYEQLKNVFGQYTAQLAITDRKKLNSDFETAFRASLSYDPIFQIDSVQIENISFSDAYIKTVEDRMKAQVLVQQKEQELAQEKIKAEIAVTQANGRAQSVIAEAKADADATVLRGDANAKAIKAQTDALSANPAFVEYTKAQRWNGILPTTVVPNGALPFFNANPVASASGKPNPGNF